MADEALRIVRASTKDLMPKPVSDRKMLLVAISPDTRKKDLCPKPFKDKLLKQAPDKAYLAGSFVDSVKGPFPSVFEWTDPANLHQLRLGVGGERKLEWAVRISESDLALLDANYQDYALYANEWYAYSVIMATQWVEPKRTRKMPVQIGPDNLTFLREFEFTIDFGDMAKLKAHWEKLKRECAATHAKTLKKCDHALADFWPIYDRVEVLFGDKLPLDQFRPFNA